MSEFGAISSQILAIQEMQLSLIKNQSDMTEKLVDIVAESIQSVPVSQEVGAKVDVSI